MVLIFIEPYPVKKKYKCLKWVLKPCKDFHLPYFTYTQNTRKYWTVNSVSVCRQPEAKGTWLRVLRVMRSVVLPQPLARHPVTARPSIADNSLEIPDATTPTRTPRDVPWVQKPRKSPERTTSMYRSRVSAPVPIAYHCPRQKTISTRTSQYPVPSRKNIHLRSLHCYAVVTFASSQKGGILGKL